MFQYAKGQITPRDKENVERHIAVCDACKRIADALMRLASQIKPAGAGGLRPVLIAIALPATAHNVRIKRGNGVIDAGGYPFAFADRYVAEDETIRLKCTYLKG